MQFPRLLYKNISQSTEMLYCLVKYLRNSLFNYSQIFHIKNMHYVRNEGIIICFPRKKVIFSF